MSSSDKSPVDVRRANRPCEAAGSSSCPMAGEKLATTDDPEEVSAICVVLSHDCMWPRTRHVAGKGYSAEPLASDAPREGRRG